MTIKQSSQSLSNNQRFFQLRPLKKTSLWKQLKSAKIGDNRGSVAVEWGLTAPLVILMIVGILEVSMVMVVNSFIEGGLREAARYGITGGTAAQNAATRQQRIREIIVENSFGLLDPNLLTISTKVYPSFNMIGDEAYTDSNHNGAYDIGEAYVDRNSNGAWDADSGIEGVGG
ncbi:MAG: TadE/TadG family type IV pilus assembly protein, partial [Dongiaceae bacterium]